MENQVATYMPNGYMIVFAVDDIDSLDEAEATLSYLKKEEILQHQAVILVANKTDLVRSRVISTGSKCTMLQKPSKCEVKARLCRDLIILPPLRFCMKSNFGEFK